MIICLMLYEEHKEVYFKHYYGFDGIDYKSITLSKKLNMFLMEIMIYSNEE